MKNRLTINIALFSSSLYVAFQLFANILSTKIALLPIVHWAVDGGTLIYPLTFTLRDFVHKTWGKKNAREVVVVAALLNGVMFLLFWLVGRMTPDPSWTLQPAYEAILLPVGRIVIASIVAQIISELIDTEIFSLIYHQFNDILAVFISNSISLIIDSCLFGFLAFIGVFPLTTVIQIIWANILIKFIVSIISVPFIKLIPRTVDSGQI
jgi:hypothetical protein